MMKLNNEVLKKLRQAAVPENEGILYLLSIYHQLDTNIIPTSVIRQVNTLGIVERDFANDELKWNMPLFEGQETNWIWVEDYRQLFKSKKIDKGGTLKGCVSKMKKFFAENPDIRKGDVIEAAKIYLTDPHLNPQYIQRADYFIFKGKGADRTSRLEEFLEILKERRKKSGHIHKVL